MAKTTIYLNKEAELIYQRAREYAGDNLSAVIVQGLKLYVEKMDITTKGMQEVIIFEGKYLMAQQVAQGKNLKFIGLKLAEGKSQDIHYEGCYYIYEIYLTKKGKFLVHSTTTNPKEFLETSSHKVFDSYSEVMNAGYPYEMLEEARKKIPEIACEELDV